MTVRPIRSIGDPVLRATASAVAPRDIAGPEIQELIDDLIDTMRDADGAGLAANQIGVPLRVTVLEVTDNPRYPYKPPIPLTVAINPRIEPLDGKKRKSASRLLNRRIGRTTHGPRRAVSEGSGAPV